MKVDMYEKVPENFHRQFLDTLGQLPEEKKRRTLKRINRKRWAVLAAAAVLALGAVTVTASEIFKWQKQAKDRFGVADELEDELTMAGVTRQENTVVQGQEAEFRLLQSVRTDRSCYYLCRMNVPEGIALDEDTCFGECYVDDDELGCAANLVLDSLETDQLLVEIEVLLPEGEDYEGQGVILHLSDLVQAHKAEVTDVLLEGEWEIPLTLLGNTEDVIYEVDQRVTFKEHELLIQKVQAGPFALRLYMEMEEARHALMFYPVQVTEIRSRDGSLAEEECYINKFGRTDDATGAFYYEAALSEAIDPADIAEIVFNCGEVRIDLLSGTVSYGAGDSKELSAGQKTAGEERNALLDVSVSDAELLENPDKLYENCGYEIITDGKGLYIHDISCGRLTLVLDLEELAYDQEKGGEIIPFSTDMAYILPFEGSDTIYVYGLVADENGEHVLSAMPVDETMKSDSYQHFREKMLEVRGS